MIRTLTGANTFALRDELSKLTKAFVAAHGDFNLDRIDCAEAEADSILAAVKASPFLSEKRLVILREPSQNKQLAEQMDKLIASVPEENDVLIVETKPDKRSVYFKLLKQKTELSEFTPLDARALAAWALGYAKEKGGELSNSDAHYLVERIGPNQQLLSHEIDKLIAYNERVSRQAIDELTEQTPQSSVFQLLDAAFSGDHRRVQKLYQDQRAQQQEPLAIMGMIAWQLHILAIVKTAGSKSSQQIADEAKLNNFVVQKAMGIARRLSLDEVKVLIRRALELDIRLKSETLDANEAVLHFLLTALPLN